MLIGSLQSRRKMVIRHVYKKLMCTTKGADKELLIVHKKKMIFLRNSEH